MNHMVQYIALSRRKRKRHSRSCSAAAAKIRLERRAFSLTLGPRCKFLRAIATIEQIKTPVLEIAARDPRPQFYYGVSSKYFSEKNIVR